MVEWQFACLLVMLPIATAVMLILKNIIKTNSWYVLHKQLSWRCIMQYQSAASGGTPAEEKTN
jgi:hypothetical protein